MRSPERPLIIPTEAEGKRYSSVELPFGTEPNMQEKVDQLTRALEAKDVQTLVTLLRQDRFVEMLVIQKGEEHKLLELLRTANGLIAQEVLGRMPHDAADIERLVKDGASAFALAESAAVAFHRQDDLTSLRIAKMVGEADVDPIARAHARNVQASLMGRHGNAHAQNALNRSALTLLHDVPEKDPRRQWASMKIEHGLLYNEDPEARISGFIALAERRKQLGDVAHVPRALLDAARAARDLGDDMQAEELYRQSYHESFAVGYMNAHQLARAELHHVLAARQHRPAVVHGIGKGERLQQLEQRWARDAAHERERTEEILDMRIPAHVLPQFGDRYLVRTFGENEEQRFSFLVVDQEISGSRGKRSSDRILKEKLLSRLGALHEVIDPAGAPNFKLDATAGRVKRPTRMLKRKDRVKKGQKECAYTLTFKENTNSLDPLVEALDKQDQVGYILLSREELISHRQAFDSGAREVIDVFMQKEVQQRAAA